MPPNADDRTRAGDPPDAAGRDARRPLAVVVDLFGVAALLALDAWLLRRLAGGLAQVSVPAIAGTVLGAYVFADFLGGLLHWIGDTWGTPDTPLIGHPLIRPFRQHHVDQTEITQVGFLELTGPNSVISLPLLIGAHLLPIDGGGPGVTLLALFLGTLLFWMFATNQHHKWAHQTRRPAWVTRLQRWHLVLSYEHHQIHHQAPHMKYYCITNGWMNAPLHRLGVHRALERAITATTGMIPRKHDVTPADRAR